MEFSAKNASAAYTSLFLPRAVEDRMLIALRQGRISKWFSSYGQEAVSVGTALAMEDDEWICTMHRNLGVFTTRDIPLRKLFAQFQGKMTGFTKGRDRSFHFGSAEHKIFGMISHLGPQLGVADGLALARKLRGEKKCVLVFSGDGGASEGDFHEALNVAAVWSLPVLIVIENNQWGLSTPSKEQFVFDSFTVKGPAYGMEAHSVDGNDFEAVYSLSKKLTESIRENPRPILLECVTFRMRGHEEASGTKYYPEGLIDSWKDKDPIDRFKSHILMNQWMNETDLKLLEDNCHKLVLDSLNEALEEPNPVFNAELELKDVYAEQVASGPTAEPTGPVHTRRMIDAIREGLEAAMDLNPNLILMGQDIADYGGVFKATEGFVERFGKDRVRNTPLCESAIVGAGVGLAVEGHAVMVEMQFSDFVTEAMTQICNQAAKLHYRWGQSLNMVIRMPTGAGVAAGPFHSQSTEAWFTRVPGLKVVYPSNAYDAKGLLIQAFQDPNPVLFFEHKALYRSQESQVPQEAYVLPFGKARVRTEGKDVTLVSYGLGMRWIEEWQKKHPSLSAEVIDMCTLVPMDFETVQNSVRKTGRCVIIQEDSFRGSFAADMSHQIQAKCFTNLDAPVEVVTSLDIPIPFSANLEQGFLANSRIEDAIFKVLNF
ncbi:MAG: dehydrogenase E1 component subunit alpha/beta [Schleiferiaceae bacterium]|nr:dehydrogenase E1 component subunit alpha/beta [Schleiferiaceae bacterium]